MWPTGTFSLMWCVRMERGVSGGIGGVFKISPWSVDDLVAFADGV